MFSKKSPQDYRKVLDGIELKTLVYGEKTTTTEFRLTKGCKLPDHTHPHEQTGYLVSGHMQLRIAEDTFAVTPGDSWCIPGDVSHGADILEDSVAIEVFSPVREEYLPK
ncbi:MAG: cupin domain-containing protein [Desulfobacteraceae bacterium]|nr:MAG: cupin domain-containing protein [Desulfobacteraceae bacterium]